MALRFLAMTLRRDPLPRDSPALASSQDRQGIGAEAGDGTNRKMKEVDHLLMNLKSAGKEIDEEAAKIIDDEIARIKAEAARGATREARRNKGISWWRIVGLAVSFAAGYCLAAELLRQAIIKELTERSHGGLGFWLMLNAIAKGGKGGVKD